MPDYAWGKRMMHIMVFIYDNESEDKRRTMKRWYMMKMMASMTKMEMVENIRKIRRAFGPWRVQISVYDL